MAYTHDVPAQEINQWLCSQGRLPESRRTRKGTNRCSCTMADELKSAKTSLRRSASLPATASPGRPEAHLDDIGSVWRSTCKTFEDWNVQFVREQIVAAAAGPVRRRQIGALRQSCHRLSSERSRRSEAVSLTIQTSIRFWRTLPHMGPDQEFHRVLGEEEQLVGSDPPSPTKAGSTRTTNLSPRLYVALVTPLLGETPACFYDKRAVAIR